MFPNSFYHDSRKFIEKKLNKCIIIEKNLCKLRKQYFDPTKDIRKNYNWFINPFVQSDQTILSLTNEEKLN
jgi:hypothetical protein